MLHLQRTFHSSKHSWVWLIIMTNSYLTCHLFSPLTYRLLQKGATWSWEETQQKDFPDVKKMLTSDCLLAHYDPNKDLTLACDASPYGVGAVLSLMDKNGQDKPIAYASRSLAPAERNYSQLEKEGLAIIFGVKKFHTYLFGRHFKILSDHKPLQHIFSPTKATPRHQQGYRGGLLV